MVPEPVNRLFWDVDPATFDPAAFPHYTIERVLELGDESAVAWLRSLFTPAVLAAVLRSSRRLSPRSANFWALVLRVPRDQVRALGATHSYPLST